MSGIAGIIETGGEKGGRTADLNLLHRMAQGMAHRGPDGIGFWSSGAVGLVHAAMHTTPESVQETQPLRDDAGLYCLTFDGRVDNRDDLQSSLKSAGARLRTAPGRILTDAELVLNSYMIWGENCANRIIGDFAFAIWDGRRRRLYCARDTLGIKPFVYHLGPSRFLFGSELRQILCDPGVSRKPNEATIAEYLADQITSTQETLYRDIQRLRPGHYLTVEQGQLREVRYWDVDPKREIRYRNDEEYAEHFREIFDEAVRCRLRSQHPVGSELSGGLDSSSVAVTAQMLLNSGRAPAPAFETFSLVHEGKTFDERRYFRSVVQHAGLLSTEVAPESFNHEALVAEVAASGHLPHAPNIIMSNTFLRLARERGIRVILTGRGGDIWLTGSLRRYADYLRELRLGTFWRELQADQHSASLRDEHYSAVSLPALPVLRIGLWPLLSPSVQASLRWLMGRGDRTPALVNRDLAQRVNLKSRTQTDTRRGQFRSTAQAHIYNRGIHAGELSYIESEDAAAAAMGIEKRHTFDDRRIVEFALAIPEEQRWRDGITKVVLRNAMGTRLPQLVRERRTKGDTSDVFVDMVNSPICATLLDQQHTVKLGWLPPGKSSVLRHRLIQSMEHDRYDFSRFVWSYWLIYSLELWAGGAPLAVPPSAPSPSA